MRPLISSIALALLSCSSNVTEAFQAPRNWSSRPWSTSFHHSHEIQVASTSTTARSATLSPRDNREQLVLSRERQDIQKEVEKEVNRRNYIWFFPPTVSAAAFVLYDDTSRLFHQALDWASGNNWQPADGGKYISEITKSALTGPVTFSVSILFGSLVGLTISNLNGRQATLRKLFIMMHQEGQEFKLLLQQCPQDLQDEALDLLARFLHRIDSTMRVSDRSTDEALRQLGELNALSRLFHSRGKEVDGVILTEIYATLGRIKNCRADLWSTYTNNFTAAHYGNMVVLASALLFIFLLETDNGAMQFLIEFQLSICWAMLLGAYSLLAAVIVDLRGIPPQLTTRLDQEAVMTDD